MTKTDHLLTCPFSCLSFSPVGTSPLSVFGKFNSTSWRLARYFALTSPAFNCVFFSPFSRPQIVATAGAVTVRFILQHTHSSRYVPIILASLNSKSKDIRRATCEYLHLILQSWQTPLLQKHVNILQDGIKKAMADSDPEARAFARKYVHFLMQY